MTSEKIDIFAVIQLLISQLNLEIRRLQPVVSWLLCAERLQWSGHTIVINNLASKPRFLKFKKRKQTGIKLQFSHKKCKPHNEARVTKTESNTVAEEKEKLSSLTGLPK